MRHARMRRWAALGILAASAGCAGPDGRDLFATFRDPPGSVRQPPNADPASVEVAARVDAVGRQLLAANPNFAPKPLFVTVGPPRSGSRPAAATAELFHTPKGDIYITQSLVTQCATDGQLAALLATEMAKLTAERAAVSRASTGTRRDTGPPPSVDVGAPSGPDGVAADRVHLAELAKYEKQRRERAEIAAVPDARVLARDYHGKAGFATPDFDAALPLLKQAAAGRDLERQFAGPARAPATP
jgi:hypothetical protein